MVPKLKVLGFLVVLLNLVLAAIILVAGILISIHESYLFGFLLSTTASGVAIGVALRKATALRVAALLTLLSAFAVAVLTWLPSPESELRIAGAVSLSMIVGMILLSIGSIIVAGRQK